MAQADIQTVHRVYGYVLAHEAESHGRDLTADAISQGTGLPLLVVDTAVDQLTHFGLLRHAPTGELLAVPPDEAMPGVLSPLESEIRARRALVQESREYILSFLPVFETAQTARERENRFLLLEDLADVRSVIADLTARARHEILTAQPGGAREGEILAEAASRDRAALNRNVRMRALYQHTARFSPGTSAYVDQIAGLGAQVRTLDDHFSRHLVFDDEAAVISVPGKPHAAGIVREPHVIAFIRETYDRLWLSAEPFSAEPVCQEIVDGIRQGIIRLLAEGLTDASIAARLGMSVRTCRRHIADIMSELGARSRFQAGYLLSARTSETSGPDLP